MWKPAVTFARIALADLGRRLPQPRSPDAHLLAAEAWLCRAQDATPDGGVSYGYSIKGGWRASYPETSGYIATTFFRLARRRDPAYGARAERIVDWLLTIQNADGSFANRRYGRRGLVFDTGQILFGLVMGHEVTKRPELLQAARRAACWLVQIADGGGRWTRSEHLDTPHVYNTRTAWALLRLNEIEHDPAREAIARSNLDWALREQQPSGFFDHCSFERGAAPFTHTIAYAARGLLESGMLLDDPRYVDAAARCADAALKTMRVDGSLPSTIAIDGTPASSSCCLTGNCQFATVWARLERARPDGERRRAVGAALDYVMSTQDLQTEDPDSRGAIKGSHPVWGPYARLSFPNWATKFFVDAMWMRMDLESSWIASTS